MAKNHRFFTALKSPYLRPNLPISKHKSPYLGQRRYHMYEYTHALASVRPSVRPSSSTISKIFFSETAGPIVLILHIHHLQVRGKNNCVFCFDRIRTLVTMVTYASHRLIMEKSENCQFLLSCWRYLNFVFEMFIE